MHNAITIAQAETLRLWAEQWDRDTGPKSREVAFMLAKASRRMRDEVDPPEDAAKSYESTLPKPPILTVVESDTD